jgi:hypothetical protein
VYWIQLAQKRVQSRSFVSAFCNNREFLHQMNDQQLLNEGLALSEVTRFVHQLVMLAALLGGPGYCAVGRAGGRGSRPQRCSCPQMTPSPRPTFTTSREAFAERSVSLLYGDTANLEFCLLLCIHGNLHNLHMALRWYNDSNTQHEMARCFNDILCF